MSIFDKDIKLPIDHLYDECKEICNFIVPGNMTHYRGDKKFMQDDIISELKRRGLFHEQYPYDHNALYKICNVRVQVWDYVRLIPRYRIWFDYNSEENQSSLGNMVLISAYFTDFVVGINGVEGNGPM